MIGVTNETGTRRDTVDVTKAYVKRCVVILYRGLRTGQ